MTPFIITIAVFAWMAGSIIWLVCMDDGGLDDVDLIHAAIWPFMLLFGLACFIADRIGPHIRNLP